MQRDRDAALLILIDKSMKKHTDNLMNALEGINARLLQLENKSCQLENSVEDLKVTLENDNGSTNGRLSWMNNTIGEVHAGVEVVNDKDKLLEAHLRPPKLQIFNAGQQIKSPVLGHMNSPPQGTGSATPYNLGSPFHVSNPFSQNITSISPYGSYYQPSSQQFHLPPPPPLQHQQPQIPQHQPLPHLHFSQPPQLTHHPDAPAYVQSLDFLPSSSDTRKRDPMEDVVEKVNSMGFPKDLVRATIKKLTNDRQAVDLNVVLDKLITEGFTS